MKNVALFLIALLLVSSASAQHFGLYKGFGGSVGYTHLYKTWPTSSHGFKGSDAMMSVDFDVFFFYVGLDFWRYKTGYEVYGYDESILTKQFKFGVALQYYFGDGLARQSSKLLFCPYVGFCSWNFLDSSGNDIGARTNYGDRDKFTNFGLKVSYRPKRLPLSIAIDGSLKAAGISLGILL